jgi:uncharacterized damage-inducible protein DinB
MNSQIIDQLIEAWRTNHRINEFLIRRIGREGMACTLSTRGGRDVVRQFAHLHNVRVWHIERRARGLASGLEVFATEDRPPRHRLLKALSASTRAVEELIRQQAKGEARGFRRGPVQTLAYFIAHESHHRGSILLTLKQCGHPLDPVARGKIWDWDRI